jgi:hypothetical protein
MNAKEYLNVALGGNMNIGTLTPLAFEKIMEAYASYKLLERPESSYYTKCSICGEDKKKTHIVCSDCIDESSML